MKQWQVIDARDWQQTEYPGTKMHGLTDSHRIVYPNG
jgi:hypothetical protein